VLDGDPAPPKMATASTFRPMSIVVKRLGGSRYHLVGGRPRPRPHCVRWGPSSPPPKGHSSSPLLGPCLLWPNGYPSQLQLSTCYCWNQFKVTSLAYTQVITLACTLCKRNLPEIFYDVGRRTAHKPNISHSVSHPGSDELKIDY